MLIQVSKKLANFCAKTKRFHSCPCHTDNKTVSSFDKNISRNAATPATNRRLFQSKGTKFNTVAIIWSTPLDQHVRFLQTRWNFYLKSKRGKCVKIKLLVTVPSSGRLVTSWRATFHFIAICFFWHVCFVVIKNVGAHWVSDGSFTVSWEDLS